MDASAAKLIGAGLAAISMGTAGIGIGIIFGNYVAGAMRNPGAAGAVFGRVILGFALTEATALFALVLALIILFVF
jgi:F-type H+-transporting ATPase subunit c